MKFLILLIVAIITVACGGGGGNSAVGGIVPAPTTLRTDLFFGYFWQDSTTVLETEATTNLLWTTGDSADQIAAMELAMADGRKVVMQLSMCLVPPDQGEVNAHWWLQRAHDAGLLANVVAISWCDEPNTPRSGSWTSENVLRMNAAVRQAMTGFPELHARLAVIYACRAAWPGITDFDWGVACDDYDSGCGALTAFYPRLEAALGPAQHDFVVPGGASPWKQDPACFLSYAESNPRVIAVVPFLWQTITDGQTYTGIRENGMRPLYDQAGHTIIGG